MVDFEFKNSSITKTLFALTGIQVLLIVWKVIGVFKEWSIKLCLPVIFMVILYVGNKIVIHQGMNKTDKFNRG